MKTMLIWEKLQSITQYIFQARDFPLSSPPPPSLTVTWPNQQYKGEVHVMKRREMQKQMAEVVIL